MQIAGAIRNYSTETGGKQASPKNERKWYVCVCDPVDFSNSNRAKVVTVRLISFLLW